MSAVPMWPVMGQSHPKRMPKMVDDLGTLFRAAKSQDSNKEVLCYNCQKKSHVARFCPQSNVVRQSSQTASRSPGNVRRCYHCQSTQHLARFCTKANNSGDRDRSEAQATVRACFSDVRIAHAASSFGRDFVAGTRVDRLTGVCAFSRDEPTNAQVCVDSAMPVVDESSEWAFGEFPKIDQLSQTLKAGMNSVKLSPLQYIDVDIEGRQCKGLVNSGAEICLISEGLAKDIQADECGHIGVRGIFSDPIRLPLTSVNIKRGEGSNYDNVADGVQVVCAIVPLKETSHSVVLSADMVADLECMPALSVMCVTVQSCDNKFEGQLCSSYVNDCMVAEVNASNDDDDDESTASVVDNADQ